MQHKWKWISSLEDIIYIYIYVSDKLQYIKLSDSYLRAWGTMFNRRLQCVPLPPLWCSLALPVCKMIILFHSIFIYVYICRSGISGDKYYPIYIHNNVYILEIHICTISNETSKLLHWKHQTLWYIGGSKCGCLAGNANKSSQISQVLLFDKLCIHQRYIYIYIYMYI